MNSADTLDLVAQAATGNDTAFERLVREHRGRVYRWALVLTGDADDADDLAQAAWIRAHRGLGGWRGEGRFTTWLYRLVHNTAVERDRTRRRRLLRLDAWRHLRRDTVVMPPDRIAAAELMETVRSYLGELPLRQRTVFALADLEDRSTAEIAEMLEIAEATVRVTLMKARRAVRERMLVRMPELREGYEE